MTSEEIKAAIHRVGNTMGHTLGEVIEALCNRPVNGCILRGKLIDLLRQADPDMHTELPKDAGGEPIHVGDVMYDCNESPSESFRVATMELCKWGWTLIDAFGERSEPSQCRHYHKPTVEELLRQFADVGIRIGAKHGIKDGEFTFTADEDAVAEYAAKLREVMADE